MKKQPLDSLTPQDRYNIKKYIELYGKAECGPLDVVLGYWNQSKKRLYHAFNNQLQIKRKIQISRNYNMIERDLHNIYHPYYVTSEYNRKAFAETDSNFSNFLLDFIIFICKDENLDLQEVKNLSRLFSYKNIINGFITNYYGNFKLQKYNFTCKDGMKTVRTIQKCLKAIKYPNIDKFQKWINEINLVDRSLTKTETLVLSIHPIDFMTMSDNKCNWSSCMSWINDGCYHAGTIEMMNSNLAVIAYIESDKKFNIELDKDNIIRIPNKSWRQLIFVSKDIILAGKAYPYQNESITITALTILRELVQKFNWDYKFINQQYGDIKHFNGNYFLKYIAEPHKKSENYKIITYTNGMYHDMIEDTGTTYWCCRNKTKKGLKLNLSGPVTCMCCGNIIHYSCDTYSYEDIKTDKICDNCHENKCEICGKIIYHPIIHEGKNFCSEDCYKEAIIFEDGFGQKRVISRSDFLSKSEKFFYYVTKNNDIRHKIISLIENRYITKKISFQEKEFKSILLENNIIYGRDYIIKQIPMIVARKGYIPRYRKTRYSATIHRKVGLSKISVESLVVKQKELYWYSRDCNHILFNKEALKDLKAINNIKLF